ncbi:uncharacterized protein LOC126762843 [Bactrocera neohumeralis]|uniref:uncharacterized protein LOC126762843 n=1 Tax=Bactrocera neohumeralis TaxID=98809 RepID=UPI002166966E|nr:uncharacterized protein LOC126762843 [Bactrocera neohumeralis]
MSAGPVLHRSSHNYHHPASYPHPHPPPHHHSSLRHLGGTAAALQREREREARCLAAAAAANIKTSGAQQQQHQLQKQQHSQHATTSSSSSLATNNQSICKIYTTGVDNNKTDNQHQEYGCDDHRSRRGSETQIPHSEYEQDAVSSEVHTEHTMKKILIHTYTQQLLAAFSTVLKGSILYTH